MKKTRIIKIYVADNPRSVNGFRAPFALAFMCAILLVFSPGCTGSKLPDDAGSSSSAMKAADPGLIKKEFIESKLITALESKSPEKIKALFDRSLLRAAHWKSLIDLACSLNESRLEAGGLQASTHQASDGGMISDISFDYKLYGFTGLEYDLFVKEGRMEFSLMTSDGGGETSQKIISDEFAGHYHLKGRVINEKSNPVRGAAVTLETEKHNFSCTTDDNGEFSIEFIDAGTFTVRFDKTGYKPSEKKIADIKKGEYSRAVDMTLERLPSAAPGILPDEDIDAGGNELQCILTPGSETRNNRLAAAASNKSVKLSWPDLKLSAQKQYSYKIFRRSPSDENFKLISTSVDADNYTDDGLVNACVYIYRVEAFVSDGPSQAAAIVFGPVAAVPASLKLAVEFEDIFSGSLKWAGVKPRVIAAKPFSGGRYISFDPFETFSLSFLTPRKIKTGYYKAFLYVQRAKSDSALKIEIKQFGDPEESKSFYRGEVSLKTTGPKAKRDVIELGEMLIEPKNWKNEPISEDHCEMSIKISGTEDPANDSGSAEKSGGENRVALDVIEFVKID
jgi:hypothetical protein